MSGAATILPVDAAAIEAAGAASVEIAEIEAARDVEIAEINADTTETIIEAEAEREDEEWRSQLDSLRLSQEDAQRSNATAMSELRERLDTMQTQQSLILSRLEAMPESQPNPDPDQPGPEPEATPEADPDPDVAPEPPAPPERKKAHRWI